MSESAFDVINTWSVNIHIHNWLIECRWIILSRNRITPDAPFVEDVHSEVHKYVK